MVLLENIAEVDDILQKVNNGGHHADGIRTAFSQDVQQNAPAGQDIHRKRCPTPSSKGVPKELKLIDRVYSPFQRNNSH